MERRDIVKNKFELYKSVMAVALLGVIGLIAALEAEGAAVRL